MNISRITIFDKRLELSTPFQHASSGYVKELHDVYVKIETDSGHFGFGEVRGNCNYTTGDNANSIIGTIKDYLAPAMLGRDPSNINAMNRLLDSAIQENYAAKAVCDIAMHDLYGQLSGRPVHELLGGKLQDCLPTEENIPFCSLEEAKALANKHLSNGCQFIKIRVGQKPFSKDIERVRIVREAVDNKGLSDKVEIGIDANQGWHVKDALRRIEFLVKEFGISLAEQPVKASCIDGLKKIKESCPVMVIADESAKTVEDLAYLAKRGAIDGVHIKLMKCGGIRKALRMIHVAEAHSLIPMVGGMDEGMAAVAAAVHCAAIADSTFFELHNHARIKNDVTSGLEITDGCVRVPDECGLGITVNEDVLNRVCEIYS